MPARFRRIIHQQAQVSSFETFYSNPESISLVGCWKMLSKLLENALAIRPCKYDAASEPLLPKVARCIPVLSSRYIGKCAACVLKRSARPHPGPPLDLYLYESANHISGPAEATKDWSDHPSQKINWGSGGAVSSPVGPGRCPFGVQGEHSEAPEISSFFMSKIPQFLTLKLVFFQKKVYKKFEINPKFEPKIYPLEWSWRLKKQKTVIFTVFQQYFLTLLRTMQTEHISRELP